MNEQDEIPIPLGSYQSSSRNMRVERDDNGTHWLIAEARKCDGSWVGSRLALKEIHNADGRLEYGLDMKIRKAWSEAIEHCNESEVELLLRVIPELAQTGVMRYRQDGTFFELPPVHVAGRKSLPIVKRLVEAKADCSPNLPMYGVSAEVTEYLFSLHPEIDARYLLINEAYMGVVHNVEIYLKHGTPPEPPPDLASQLSPLHGACFYSPRLQGFDSDDGFEPAPFREIVKMLIDAGADVNARVAVEQPCDVGPISIHAETPLHFASAGGDVEIVRMLLAAGAEPNAKNTLDETPAEWARKYYGNDTILSMLRP